MMSACDPVVRRVSVRGSCAEWFPAVEESLRSHGFFRVAADLPSKRLTAAYAGGSLSITLSPSSDGLDAIISVFVFPLMRGCRLPW